MQYNTIPYSKLNYSTIGRKDGKEGKMEEGRTGREEGPRSSGGGCQGRTERSEGRK
jgi:hypothetical protein